MNYRDSALPSMVPPPVRPWWGARAWRRLVGELVYTGPRICAHCKHWTQGKTRTRVWSNLSAAHVWRDVKDEEAKGDCKLLFGKEDKYAQDEACEDDRFQPRRRYMHRVKR